MIKGKCLVCKRTFLYKPCDQKGKFCSYKCYWKSKIGKPSWNKNKEGIYSKKSLIKMSLAKKGKPNPKLGKAIKKYYKTHDGYWKNKKFAKKHRKKLSISHKNIQKGDKHPNWKGGVIKDRGYILIHQPNHPRAVRGYIRRSHFVMEQHIGRYLTKEEVIHHINSIRDDDRIKNLQLFPNKSEHRKHHAKHKS